METEKINRIIKAILNDDPRIFWFSGKWILRDSGGHRCLFPQYILSEPEIVQAQRVIEQYWGWILKLPDIPDYDRARWVFDWMLENISYGMGTTLGQTIFDVFVEQKAVCKGISKAYQLLLGGMGMHAILVEGTLDGVAKHVWNLVELGGRWLHVDVCMGYERFSALFPEDQKKDPYRCFMVTEEEITRTHRICN
jgi:hypothetical protein